MEREVVYAGYAFEESMVAQEFGAAADAGFCVNPGKFDYFLPCCEWLRTQYCKVCAKLKRLNNVGIKNESQLLKCLAKLWKVGQLYRLKLVSMEQL
ncbi:hypothetical protein [Arsenicibacter rosenii]|uniref:hypothetical protein n=1 Tax=Arsenicibacter rosenii TaxID=1750698 RepID=UPI00116029FA|nr:hypothetical protein [Arsenicibacter rosenii]